MDAAKKKADEDWEEEEYNRSIKLAERLCDQLVEEETILSERGREDILVDAFKDGSSVVCPRCSSLIPRVRAEAHAKWWCSEAVGEIDSDEDNDD